MDRRLRRDVVWNLVPVVLLGVVGLGLNFAIARWWSAEALAVWNLVTIAYFVLAILGSSGLQYSVLRAVAEKPDDREHVAAAVVGALVPNVVLAAGATLGFIALSNPVARLHGSDAVAEGMLWAAPGLFCLSINKVLFGVVNGMRRMRAYAVYTSLRYVLIAVGLLVLRETHATAGQLAGIWSITEGGVIIVLAIEVAANVSFRRASGWRRWTRDHLDYGVRGVAATLAYEINTKLDVWMLGALGVVKGQVGIYALVAAINEGVTQLAVVVQNNVNPMIARDLATGARADVLALVHRTRRWFVPAFAAICALCAIVYPPVIPHVIGDAAFGDGSLPFAILVAGLALASPYLPFMQVLLMGNRPGWHTALMLIVVGVNFAAQLVLIPWLGLIGAAAGTALAFVVAALLVRYFSRLRLELAL
jgi:O-antigen/teichoic acid export membrane protein